ncbi:MFS transporter [Bradyrhizobium sp. RDM4]|uniref:MFS transporter n=1 Tax=Bradyrhizobium sp. RDM4 TaxID=3378765 RepID=UPI0038FC7172
MAVGGGIVPALAALAINTEGWAAGFYLLGILPLLVGIPMVFLLETPALNIHAGRSDGTAALSDRPLYAEGMSFRDALRSRVFYTLLVIFLLTPMAMHALQLHLVSLLSDRGVSTAFSVGALSFLFSVSLVSGLVLGFIFDRFFAPKIGALCLFLTSLGVLLLLFVHDSSPALTMLAVGLLGLGAGTEGDLIALLISRYFGMRSYGVIYGAVFAALMLGSAVGPFLLGWIFDDFKSYDVALYGCAAAPALCALLLLTLPRYVFAEPEEQTPPAAVVPAV